MGCFKIVHYIFTDNNNSHLLVLFYVLGILSVLDCYIHYMNYIHRKPKRRVLHFTHKKIEVQS